MITWSDLVNSLWLAAFLIAVSLFLYGLLCLGVWLCLPLDLRIRRATLAGLVGGFPLGFTGLVSGFLTGSSRTSAVGALIPAALTLIGIMVVYLVGKGVIKALITGFSVFLLAVNLLVGTFLGNTSRMRFDEVQESVDVQKEKATKELAIRLFRGALGLPPDPPKPVPAAPAPEK